MSTCPRCQTALTRSEYEGAAVESCPSCQGQWLGAAELKHIVATREKTWRPADLAAVGAAPPLGVSVREMTERLACPVCARPMEPFNYAGDSGILLDKCGGCGGIWLDGGELEQVQMVVEAADLALRRDVGRFADRLHELEIREDARELNDTRGTRAPLLAALLSRVAGDEA
jgi:Zn-finger nucleic acid-binding protein